MFTLFGQFFDHGLDLVGKSGTEVVVVPLATMIRCTCPGSPDQLHHRQPDDPRSGSLDAINTTTPWIDQNQTYGSTRPSRSSCVSTSRMGPASPSPTGRLLDGVGGNIANWAEIKAQAATILGIQLVDTDVTASRCCSPTSTATSCVGPTGSRRW